MRLKLSEIALSIIQSIRQQLEECLGELEKIEKNIKESPPEMIGKTEFTKETPEELPWKSFRSGKGAWIFRNLNHPVAQMLVDMLARNGGSTELHGRQYKFSGPNNKLISRFG